MSKKSLIEREKKRTKLVKKYAVKKEQLFKKIKSGSEEEAWHARLELTKIPRNAHKSRGTRRCNLTGRPRAVYRKFGVCRNKLRELFNDGFIPGMTKSSW